MQIIIIISVLFNVLLMFGVAVFMIKQKTFREDCKLNIENLMKENSRLIDKILLMLKD